MVMSAGEVLMMVTGAFRRRSIVPGLILAVLPALVGCGEKEPATWRVIARPGEAIISPEAATAPEKTHSVAAAWVARYHGLDDPNRTDRQFIATMRLFVGVPECPSCPTLSSWDIERGLKNYFMAKDRPDAEASQRYKYAPDEGQRAVFEDYVAEIDAGRPVVLTLSYFSAARDEIDAARLRHRRCFSVVGIGYSRYRGRDYFICHDGLTDHLEDDIDAFDRVGPLTAGLDGVEGPWQQPGTSIYRWDGDYTNIIMVLFNPEPAET